MSDLISREAALDLLRYYPIKNPEPTDVIPAVLETARKFIAKLPAVDAVEVVRCRECIHCALTEDGEYNPQDIVCEWWATDGLKATDFCSHGKRRNP